MNAEMDHHLASEKGTGNSRNGYGRKTVITDTGKIELEAPRDRQATFDPQLIAKYHLRHSKLPEFPAHSPRQAWRRGGQSAVVLTGDPETKLLRLRRP